MNASKRLPRQEKPLRPSLAGGGTGTLAGTSASADEDDAAEEEDDAAGPHGAAPGADTWLEGGGGEGGRGRTASTRDASNADWPKTRSERSDKEAIKLEIPAFARNRRGHSESSDIMVPMDIVAAQVEEPSETMRPIFDPKSGPSCRMPRGATCLDARMPKGAPSPNDELPSNLCAEPTLFIRLGWSNPLKLDPSSSPHTNHGFSNAAAASGRSSGLFCNKLAKKSFKSGLILSKRRRLSKFKLACIVRRKMVMTSGPLNGKHCETM
mmetsp:Transcript_57496/g.166978  ORF Transcript_57496/g.166978 Transcript_57496/m.166978 type:complete len:267 (-) Transcript_57496:865-1665(-)